MIPKLITYLRSFLHYVLILWYCCVAAAILCYLFYLSYVPKFHKMLPIPIQFNSECEQERRVCSFPSGMIHLKQEERLSSWQEYSFRIQLNVPESQRNIDSGMFIVQLSLLGHNAEVIKNFRRSIMLEFRSSLLRILRTIFLFPLILSSYISQKQQLTLSIWDRFIENPSQPVRDIAVTIESTAVDIYDVELFIEPELSGFAYFVHHWPITTLLLCYCVFLFMNVIMAIIVFGIQIMKQGTGDAKVKSNAVAVNTETVTTAYQESDAPALPEPEIGERDEQELFRIKKES